MANFIKQATSKHKGLFKKKAQAAGMSTAAYAAKEASAPGKLGKEARLAQTLMGLKKKNRTKSPKKKPGLSILD